jgi:hypothetical protein
MSRRDRSAEGAILGDGVSEMEQRGAIGFAEKLLELLDEGRYTTTYKYALLLALMDVCLEHTQRSGAAPEMVTTRQIVDKIVELYWPHTVPFVGVAPAGVLKQARTSGQAEIISAITRFRARHASDPSVPQWESRMRAPERSSSSPTTSTGASSITSTPRTTRRRSAAACASSGRACRRS